MGSEKKGSNTMTLLKFPAKEQPKSLLIGPFEEYRVIVDGRIIPKLTGRKTEDGRYNFFIDNRFGGGPFSADDAEQVAWLLAQALAVGMGYAHLGADLPGMSFAALAMPIDGEETT